MTASVRVESPHEAFPLRHVATQTGLSADIIRAWEKRYGVVSPVRGPRGARLYTSEDIATLRLLARVVGAGRSIGDVARLTRAELEALAGTASRTGVRLREPVDSSDHVERILVHVAAFDAPNLTRELGDALVALGSVEFVCRIAAPLLHEVGERWSQDRLSVAEEHLVSSVMRNLLAGLIQRRDRKGGPSILLATPSGERHEFGVLLVSLLALDSGVVLEPLGADLPAEQIVQAARRTKASVVGLGVVDSANRERAVSEIEAVERGLPPETALWIGGRDARAVVPALGSTRAMLLEDLGAVENELLRLTAKGL